MRLTYNELLVSIKALEVLSGLRSLKKEDIMDIKAMISKLRNYGELKLRFTLDRSKQKEIMEVAGEVTEWVRRYSEMRDTSLLFEYDTMKKSQVMIMDKLASIRSVLDSELVVAEEDMRIIRDKIAMELYEGGNAKSLTEADRRARVDPRYERVLEDYRTLLRMANTIRRKYEVMGQCGSSVIQSVSMGKIGMVQQSYNINEYEKKKNTATGSTASDT